MFAPEYGQGNGKDLFTIVADNNQGPDEVIIERKSGHDAYGCKDGEAEWNHDVPVHAEFRSAVNPSSIEKILRNFGNKGAAQENPEDLSPGNVRQNERPARVQKSQVLDQKKHGDQGQNPRNHEERDDNIKKDVLEGKSVPGKNITAERGEKYHAESGGCTYKQAVPDIAKHRAECPGVMLKVEDNRRTPEIRINVSIGFKRKRQHHDKGDECDREKHGQGEEDEDLFYVFHDTPVTPRLWIE